MTPTPIHQLLVEVGDTTRKDRNVQKAYYDSETKRLYIQFHNGSVYVYKDVPEPVGTGIFKAESGGVYLNRFVKPFFQYEKLTPQEDSQ